ncbi:MAG: hypothetical protein DRN53_01700 [Thermoprotei archaeon]|nr:MAG: hypothetical protein DRN53_01700 [Thermoprotei archaeon]
MKGENMFGILIVKGEISARGCSPGSRATPPYLKADINIAFKPHPTGANIPYIPATSWVGVMRNLLEKYYDLPANAPRIVRAKRIVAPIHECEDDAEKLKCPVCKLLSRRDVVAWFDDAEPKGTRYQVTPRGDRVEVRNEQGQTVATIYLKTEVTIPREPERVKIPREYTGWRMEPIPRNVQMVSGIFEFAAKFDIGRLQIDDIRPFFVGLALLEDYYVGRRGTRGYGRVEISNISVRLRGRPYYEGVGREIEIPEIPKTPKEILEKWKEVKDAIERAKKKLEEELKPR